MKKRAPKSDMEQVIGYVLFTGVAISAVLIMAGLLWTFARTGRVLLSDPVSGANIWRFWLMTGQAFLHPGWKPVLFVNGGIAALLLTPYLRVLASLLYFVFVERNGKFVFFTGVVLAILTYSLFLR